MWCGPDGIKKLLRVSKESQDPSNHFVAYRLLKSDSRAAQGHSIDDSGYLEVYCKQLARHIGNPRSILDAGSGSGALTSAIAASFPGAFVLGVEASRDAVNYAKRKYKNCSFRNFIFNGKYRSKKKFDVIHAREFYAFTRSSDIELHRLHIEEFGRNLEPGGLMVLSFAGEENTICENLGRFGASLILKEPVIKKAFYKLPIWLGVFLSWIATKIFNKSHAYLYIFKKVKWHQF